MNLKAKFSSDIVVKEKENLLVMLTGNGDPI
jgi:hypothetical protein